jgi:hypothetical protein
MTSVSAFDAGRRRAAYGRFEPALKMAAPYLAVGIFWCLLHSAWLAILAYHAQILWWSRGSFPKPALPGRTPAMMFVIPSALVGPLLYYILPHVTRANLSWWLAGHRLSGAGFVVMVFYFGLVHPVLEQIHWTPLRESGPLGHIAFAGYHMLVLYSLMKIPWLAVCFVVLVTASLMWRRMARESGSLVPSIASHGAADLGLMIAAWLRM